MNSLYSNNWKGELNWEVNYFKIKLEKKLAFFSRFWGLSKLRWLFISNSGLSETWPKEAAYQSKFVC